MQLQSTEDGRTRPGFLVLPERSAKPRVSGITHVLDKGMPILMLESFLGQIAQYVDYLKTGWGTAYVDPSITQRIALCSRLGIKTCLGGTLFEICAAQGRLVEFCRWAQKVGLSTLEVSNGLQLMSQKTKSTLIRNLSKDFSVLAETGAKSADVHVDPAQWAGEMESDLESGAELVIAEGRESGTVGLYQKNQAVRSDLVEAISARIPLNRVILEAPQKAQQLWLIQHFGTAVNLGNVSLEEVLPLETLRLGLRADTALGASVSPECGTVLA
ncbi:phosphosulfolactate synthase [Actinocatenispora thailandica]|uniref:Phosphosulfolactate synthase n=1 Tax=Actinocatenispora thailandica TaxID=227318 RepID=A0A7R7DLE3_9ACTN|nr:phosphosulfolactate synthase [Actinocatenispora thailandica]BCJ33869.1 phosphosulfolactate synthase [Actinocatenispora thailandica]